MEHAALRQFWAGLGRSHQGVGAVSTSFEQFFVEERVELMNGFRKQEDEEMDVGQDDTVSSNRWSWKDFYFEGGLDVLRLF